MFDVLVFPGANRSAAHLERLKTLLREAQGSVDVGMYVLTHEGLADTLIAAKDSGVTLRLVADHTQMMCKGSLAKKLLSAKVDVFVHPDPKYSMGHQYVIVDDSTLALGSVNWTERTMVSGGMITITSDPRGTLPVLINFEEMVATYRTLEMNEYEESASWCPQCTEYRAMHGTREYADASGTCIAE